MNPKLKLFLLRWANNSVAVMVAAAMVPGIHCKTLPALVAAAFLLGILNMFIRRVLIFLALPLVVISLGFFILVINALLLYFVGYVMNSFEASFKVDSFRAAFWGGLIISIVSMVLNLLVGASKARIQVHRVGPPPAANPKDDDVIDV